MAYQETKEKVETGDYVFWKCMMFHGRSNITGSFTEHLNCHDETTFTCVICVNSRNIK